MGFECLLQHLEVVVAAFEFQCGTMFLRGVGHGSPHRRDVERLVQVVAGPVAQRLSRGLDGLESGEHDDLDGGGDQLDFLERLHAGEAEHHDVEDDDVDGVGFDQLDGIHSVGREEDGVVVFENDAQGLARPLLVIDDEQGGFGGVRCRRGGHPGRLRNRSRR